MNTGDGMFNYIFTHIYSHFYLFSLNAVFVLDVGRTIFQWNGPGASRTERVWNSFKIKNKNNIKIKEVIITQIK